VPKGRTYPAEFRSEAVRFFVSTHARLTPHGSLGGGSGSRSTTCGALVEVVGGIHRRRGGLVLRIRRVRRSGVLGRPIGALQPQETRIDLGGPIPWAPALAARRAYDPAPPIGA
jgi:hypothetical protein